MSTKAIILAAGKSSRLYPLTLETPKSLLDIGGIQPIVRIVTLLENEGIKDITVVVGHKKEKIMSTLGSRVRYHEFPEFDTKNNLHTFWSVRDKIDGDTLVLYADLIFEPEVLKKMLAHPGDICLAIDTSALRQESPQVRIENGAIMKVDKENPTCNFLGITKLSRRGAEAFLMAIETLIENNPHAYYSDAINVLIEKGIPATPVDIAGSKWIEIDTHEDLEAAKKLKTEIA